MSNETPTARPLVDLPQKVQTKIIQAHVDPSLYAAARAEAKRRRKSVREVLEWGLKEFLAYSAPEEARKLGIILRK